MDDFYELTAGYYDKRRFISSLYSVLIGGYVRVPLDQIRVLDMGGGTGAIAETILEAGVGTVYVVDPYKPMLDIAEQRLKQYIINNRVSTKLDGLPHMDFHDQSFHTVMMNGIVHLLDDYPLRPQGPNKWPTERPPLAQVPEKRPQLLQSLREAHRVLKPSGLLIVTGKMPHQLAHTRWYAQFFPWSTDYCYPRTAHQPEMELLLKLAGFNQVSTLVDISETPEEETVPTNPFSLETLIKRSADSDFSSMTESELKEMESAISESIDKGELEGIMRRTRENQKNMGTMTMFTAVKA